jgi:transposase
MHGILAITDRVSHHRRPPDFDREEYKLRNVVERCSNRIRQFRDPAASGAERAACYGFELSPAAIVLGWDVSQDMPWRLCADPTGWHNL